MPPGAGCKEPSCQCRRHKRLRVQSLGWEKRWRRAWPSTPGFLPGESLEQRSLVGFGCHRVAKNGHDWSNLACMHLCVNIVLYTLNRYSFFFLGVFCVASVVARSLRSFQLVSWCFYHTSYHTSLSISLQTLHSINPIHDYNFMFTPLESNIKSLNLEVAFGSSDTCDKPLIDEFLGVHLITDQEIPANCHGFITRIQNYPKKSWILGRSKLVL